MFGNHECGIYEKAFSPDVSWRERLMRAKELGFDFVEISIDETDERLARLDSLGYTGPYMIEMWYENGTDDITEIAKAKQWLGGQYKRR